MCGGHATQQEGLLCSHRTSRAESTTRMELPHNSCSQVRVRVESSQEGVIKAWPVVLSERPRSQSELASAPATER